MDLAGNEKKLAVNERAKLLFNKLRKEGLPMDDFIYKCVQWTLDDIEIYRFEKLPEKPAQVIEYEKIPMDERKYLSGDYYRENTQIVPYYEAVINIKSSNKALLDWLVECTKIVKTTEELNLLTYKIDEVTPELLPARKEG